MGKLPDYIAAYVPPEDADADLNTIFADITTAYEDDMSGANAAVSERDALIADLTAQLTATKAHNYDLLQEVARTDEPQEESDVIDSGPDDNGNGEVKSIDELFG